MAEVSHTHRSMNYVYLVALAGNLLALTGDTTLTWSSPIIPKLRSNNSENPLGRIITDEEEEWIGSFNHIGAIVGMLPFGYLADRVGRKPVLLFLALPHIAAYLLVAFAEHISLYYVARLLSGISLSSVYMVLPMYVAEISEDSYRGTLLVSYTTFASLGDLFPYVLGPYVSIFWFNILSCIFPVTFFCLFLLLAPESPFYYIHVNNIDKAKESLLRLRSGNSQKVEMELENIEVEYKWFRQQTSGPHDEKIIDTLRTRYVVKGFVIALCLSAFQQLSGISAVLAYTEEIFIEAGSDVSAELSCIIIGLILFAASFCGPMLVDRKGRRFLLIVSSAGMMVSEALLGVYFYLLDNYEHDISAIAWLPLVCLVVYTISFNAGFGPLPFTVTSEILPSNVKFMIATFTGCMGWVVSFLVTRFYIDLNDSIGRGETFWLFTLFCASALAFVVFIVPETKGKSFQEIQHILGK